MALLRTVQGMAVVMLATLALILGTAGYWVFDHRAVLDGSDWRLHVTTPVVAPGDDLVYTMQVCKRIPLGSVWSRQIVDTVEWALPDERTSLPIGCGTYTLFQTVPQVLVDGRYRLVIMVTYDVNPLRTVVYRFESDAFEVRR